MNVSRLELVELIEGAAAKLSPEGRELAERMELLAEVPPPGDEGAVYRTQRAQADEVLDLPAHDQDLIDRLLLLWAGLAESDEAERQGKDGTPRRNMAVIVAAGSKDRREGRQIDPYMTPEQAVARLREPG